jgi:hypothetical protein
MDVTGVAWRKISYSGDQDGPQLAFAADTWKAFTKRLKA